MTLTPEDLRPETLDELVGQDQAVKLLKGLIAQSKAGIPLPHLLLSGPFGTGKTTAAYAVARELLGESWQENFRELDTSQDRGVDAIRQDVLPWLTRMPAYDAPFKVLYISEADYLTPVAQAALRRVIEIQSDVTRFIFDCNTPSQIIGAIHSRCLHVRFRPLTDDEIRTVVAGAAKKLGLTPSDDLIRSIVRHSKGQPRDAVNALIGGDKGLDWERLDSAVVTLFTTSGVDRTARISAFIDYLRSAGHTEWGEIIHTMDSVIREKNLTTKGGYDHFIRESVITAYQCKWVDLPLYAIKGLAHEVIP